MTKSNRYVLGKVDYNNSGRKNCESVITWKFDGEKFSMCAEIWNPGKTDIYCGGQCVDTVAAYFPEDAKAARMVAVWEKYHLNDMRAGSQAQSAHLATLGEWKHGRDGFNSHYLWALAKLEEVGLQPDKSFLRTRPNQPGSQEPIPYSYGSEWLKSEIPADVKSEILSWSGDDSGGKPETKRGAPFEKAAAELGLSMTAAFVPFSKSRNKAEKYPSLNWQVTIRKGDIAILVRDYSAGSTHCPGNKTKRRYEGDELVRWECENGYAGWAMNVNRISARDRKKPLMPSFADVLTSLMQDGGAIDYANYESWAGEFGYDSDSIKGRDIYKQCLETGLALRAALGDDGMRTLRELTQ